jgi:hypothetical protein
MRRAIQRAILVTTVAALFAGVGPALFASTASAQGGIDTSGQVWGQVNNLTPYKLTFAAAGQPNWTPGVCCWQRAFPQSFDPGGAFVYVLSSWTNTGSIGNEYNYDGWFTYKADVVGGPPEYLTVAISGYYCTGGETLRCSGGFYVQVYNTVAPPPQSYDPGATKDPTQKAPPGVAATPNPQISWSQDPSPFFSDVTFAARGKFTIDASTGQGQPFADLLNSVCGAQAGLAGTSCSFTQTQPITYGPGTLTGPQTANSCKLPSAAPGGQPSTGSGDGPPESDPNYFTVEYTAAQSASLSVGGGVTASAETELFGLVAAEASVSVEAEHEWEEVKTVTREATVWIPDNSWGLVWVAPTVGRVTGTLVATIGPATFTANNFTEVRSGVTGVTDPLTQPTPAFNIVTRTRPMTAAELKKFCGIGSSARASASSQLKARRAAPRARLVPHRSVARVALGETQEAVVRRLGHPAEKRFQLEPCRGMPGCTAVRGLHGTWNYKRRKLSVVFGPDRRVAALIHSGNQRTRDGVGTDSTMAHLRGKFPGIKCAKLHKRIDCTLKRVSGPQTVSTVFRLTDRGHGRWKTTKVLIYVDRSGQENA